MRPQLYTDNARHELAPYTTNASVSLSLSAPYASADITLTIDAHKAPPFLERTATGAPALEGWLVIRDDNERALFIGPLTSISEQGQAGPSGTLSRSLRLTAASPLHILQSAQLALTARAVSAAGAYDLKAWGPRLRALIRAPFESYQVGRVLERTYEVLAAPYRLPLTLANAAHLDRLPVIYSQARAREYAPEREADLRSVHGLAVQLISAAAGAQGTPWGVLSSAFDVDPSLVELYYSLEPHKSGTISEALGGATPCIIYRFKPWAAGAIASSAARSLAAINEETREAAKTPHRIPRAQVLNYQASLTDGERVNAVYLDSPFTASQGVETFGLTISPSIDSEDTRTRGLRLYKARWPFFPPKSRGQNIKNNLAYVQDIAAAIIGQPHRFARASLSTAYRPDLRAGLWVRVELPHALLIGYTENISHQVSIDATGAQRRRSGLTLVRCFYEEVRT